MAGCAGTRDFLNGLRVAGRLWGSHGDKLTNAAHGRSYDDEQLGRSSPRPIVTDPNLARENPASPNMLPASPGFGVIRQTSYEVMPPSSPLMIPRSAGVGEPSSPRSIPRRQAPSARDTTSPSPIFYGSKGPRDNFSALYSSSAPEGSRPVLFRSISRDSASGYGPSSSPRADSTTPSPLTVPRPIRPYAQVGASSTPSLSPPILSPISPKLGQSTTASSTSQFPRPIQRSSLANPTPTLLRQSSSDFILMSGPAYGASPSRFRNGTGEARLGSITANHARVHDLDRTSDKSASPVQQAQAYIGQHHQQRPAAHRATRSSGDEVGISSLMEMELLQTSCAGSGSQPSMVAPRRKNDVQSSGSGLPVGA